MTPNKKSIICFTVLDNKSRTLTFNQNDSNICEIEFSVYQDSLVNKETGITSAVINIDPPSGEPISYGSDNITIVDNVITFVLPPTALTSAGNGYNGELFIYGADYQRRTICKFKYNVKAEIVFDNPIQDDEHYPVLTALINQTQNLYDEALNLSVENANAEMVAARKGEVNLPTKIGKIDSSLANNVQQLKNISVPYDYQGAVVTFVDDDGTSVFYNTTKALYDARGVRCSVAIITSAVGNANQMTLAQIKECQSDNFEIVSHSVHHDENLFKEATHDLTQVPDATIEAEFMDSQQWLKDNGFNGYDTFVYPWGGFTTSLIRYKRFARKYYKYALNAMGSLNVSPVDNMYLSRYSIISSNSLDSLKAMVDDCIAKKGWLIFLHHSGDVVNFSADQIGQLLDYIISKNVPIMTVGDASKLKGNAVAVGEYTDNNNSLYIGIDGKTSLKTNILMPSTTNNMDLPLTSYAKNTKTIVPLINTSDTFICKGGIMEVYNYENQNLYSYVNYIPTDSNTIYQRKWINGAWSQWSSCSGITATPITHVATDLITVFPANKMTFTEVGNSYATGFPENSAGVLMTYRGLIDVFSYQEYHIRQTNKVYKRYWDNTNSIWTAWVKVSAV